jgi:hypothetical protein
MISAHTNNGREAEIRHAQVMLQDEVQDILRQYKQVFGEYGHAFERVKQIKLGRIRSISPGLEVTKVQKVGATLGEAFKSVASFEDDIDSLDSMSADDAREQVRQRLNGLGFWRDQLQVIRAAGAKAKMIEAELSLLDRMGVTDYDPNEE